MSENFNANTMTSKVWRMQRKRKRVRMKRKSERNSDKKKENDHVFTPILLTQTRKITFMKNNAKDSIYTVRTMTDPK